jgi:GNAT superfamily N-acetyltransferase
VALVTISGQPRQTEGAPGRMRRFPLKPEFFNWNEDTGLGYHLPMVDLVRPLDEWREPMECTIRAALEDDADEISAVILRTLRETNAKDYAREIIERVEPSFSPSAVLQLIGKRTVFVATIGSRVVGTASLDGSVVRTVFVAPDVQARGIGKLLMGEIERTARARNIPMLAVSSSVTAETFYVQLGFRAVRDSYHGDERTIIMERSLADVL